MAKFIKLTELKFDGYGGCKKEPRAFNTNHITNFASGGERYHVAVTNVYVTEIANPVYVKETPEQILKLIEEAK